MLGYRGPLFHLLSRLPLLAQLNPPIPNFSRDSMGKDSNTFVDWSEQFQLVAEACQWSDQVKLVNLAACLKGQAYAFYRSCFPAQRASYPALMEPLLHRLHLLPFSQYRQVNSTRGSKGLRSQHHTGVKAIVSEILSYNASRGSQDAKEMEKAVLASQFVTGLREDIYKG